MLRDFLSMANGNNLEDDSILGHAIESDSEDETIIMSQRFVAESWTPEIPGINVSSSSVFEQRMEIYSTSMNSKSIPQLDGAHDDEDYEQYGKYFFFNVSNVVFLVYTFLFCTTNLFIWYYFSSLLTDNY